MEPIIGVKCNMIMGIVSQREQRLAIGEGYALACPPTQLPVSQESWDQSKLEVIIQGQRKLEEA